ncbi:acyl-CoA thioesterase [Luteolibacter algae]|uniref:Acyl-CoA thioesterase n=1 Tax=Luteolibacter algae TaxID=454151 RepID=A0ABW5D4I9_9BACT
MNLRWLNALLWGNSVALAWMWGLGLFFSIQISFMFGMQGLLMFAIPNALGLMLFGWLTQIVANRHQGGQESLSLFFDKFAKPFRLIFYIYQIVALSLTVFALVKYLFVPLLGSMDALSGAAVMALAVCMSVFVLLAVGCLLGEEFGIRKIKAGHALLGGLLVLCIVTILFSLSPPNLGEGTAGLGGEYGYTSNRFWGLAVPLVVGLLFGPWLDLQHWQRAIQIHREKTSIRLSYVFGGAIFFLLLLFHGSLAMWVMGNASGTVVPNQSSLDDLTYGHHIVVQYFSGANFSGGSWLPAAYFGFLCICILTTLDSGYVALRWFLEKNVEKSENMLLSIIPKQVVSSPIPTFFLIAIITIIGYFAKFELEYFMVFFASFFVGYAALAIARCFVPNSQQPLPQIRMFSMACLCLVIFAFGYMADQNALMYLGSLLPLAYVVWLVVTTDLLRLVTEKAGEVMDAAAEIPAIKAISKPEHAVVKTVVSAPEPGGTHDLAGHFEGKWFVYSMIATYSDTNSVGNVYFGMYPMYVGKTRELFFNAAMPDFDLKTTKFYILTRSFEHKFVRESREFDTITVKIKVAEANRKFCTLEHQIFGSEGQLLGKGKQSLLFVSSKDYGLLDIPSEVYTAFMKYL